MAFPQRRSVNLQISYVQAPSDLTISVFDALTLTESVTTKLTVQTMVRDDFADGSIDAAKWTNNGGANITESGGTLNIATDATLGYFDIKSVLLGDLTGNQGSIRVVDAGNQSLVSYEAYPLILSKDASGTDQLIVFIGEGTVRVYTKIASVSTQRGSVAYDATTMKFFRIRESAGTIFWDYSADFNSWTNIASFATPFVITNMSFSMQAGTYADEGVATALKLDDVNLNTLYIEVNDALTVTEDVSVTTTGGATLINVFDALTVTESLQIERTSFVSVFDALTITENINTNVLSFVSVSDALTVTESVQVTNIYQISVSDALTITESVTLERTSFISVFDALTVADVPTVQKISLVSVSDSLSITESVTTSGTLFVSVFDALTVDEAHTVVIQGAGLVISVTDDITINENTQFFFNLWNASVFDALTITESVQNTGTLGNISVFDTVAVNENVSTSVSSSVSVFDAVSLTESVTMHLTSFINVFDTCTITENTATALFANISVSDVVSIAESVTMAGTLGGISVSDSLTLSEDVSVTGILTASVFDTCSLTENVDRILLMNVSVSDALSCAENIQRLVFFSLEVSDDLSITETTTVTAPLAGVSVFDTLTCLDVPAAEKFLTINNFDTVSVAEAITTDSYRFSPQIPMSRPRSGPKASPMRIQGMGASSRQPLAMGGAK